MVLNTATHGADQMMVQRILQHARKGRQRRAVASGFVILAQFALFLFMVRVSGYSTERFRHRRSVAQTKLSPTSSFITCRQECWAGDRGGLLGGDGHLGRSFNSSASTIVNDLYRPYTGGTTNGI